MSQFAAANTLMVQGTTSDAGKSVCVAGLCRVFKRKGFNVAPFKPQNMALNSAVTVDGGEIGRAQAVQAQACGLAPHTDFNPVLLKPNTDIGAQVIVHGHPVAELDAKAYHDYKQVAMQAVLDSHQRLAQQYQLIMVEGAGSPAEINLRDRDIANMGFAEAVDCPVILIADIDRGGVFAHLVGTLDLLSASEQNRVVGFIINKFRGDISLLQSGLDWLEQRTGKPVLGVIPYIHDLVLEAEDAISQQQISNDVKIKVAVPVLSRISNHNDFDPLLQHPEVELTFVGPGQSIPPADLIILPGSKSVRQDLALLKQHGWDQDIQRHLRYGGKLLGICGGMQMLGLAIHDPQAIEGEAGSSQGLGYAHFTTELAPQKQLKNVTGVFELGGMTAELTGYEIHAGISKGRAFEQPLTRLTDQHGAHYSDGFISEDGQIIGTYVHGIFDHADALAALLNWVSPTQQLASFDIAQKREQSLQRLADVYQQHLDIERIQALITTN